MVLAWLMVAGSARAAGETAPATSSGNATRVAQVAPSGPPAAPAAPEELVPRVLPTERVFYGWEILATGEVGGALVAASVWLPSSEVGTPASTFAFLIGMPTYAVAGPLVHWGHGHWVKGLASLGLNVAGATIGGIVGSAVQCNRQGAPGDCSLKGVFNGLAVAGLTVPLIDAGVLGWEDVQVSDPVAARTGSTRVALAPLMSVGPRSLSLGVGGRF